MSRHIPRLCAAIDLLRAVLVFRFCTAISMCLAAALPLSAQENQQPQPPSPEQSAPQTPRPDEEGWYTLFGGESLAGWRASENRDSCKVEDGLIVVGGPRSHLFYNGPVADHNFTDFELKLEVLTEPGSNSGIYFHTEYQEEGWPDKGYEAQVNATHSDWRKTGSLYAVEDVRDPPAEDNEWFEYHIIVRGKQITLKVNGETTVDYTEPENPEHLANDPGRKLSSGTIALQAHDPGSTVRYRNIRIKPSP